MLRVVKDIQNASVNVYTVMIALAVVSNIRIVSRLNVHFGPNGLNGHLVRAHVVRVK